MKHLSIFLLLCSMYILNSCTGQGIKGEGVTATDQRTVPLFNAIEAHGDITVDVMHSNEYKVVVTGYQNLVPIFETNVNNKTLKLVFRNDYYNIRNNNIRVTVYTPSFEKLYVNGSAKATIQDHAATGTLSAEVNGSGVIHAGNNAFTSLYTKVNGSGLVEAGNAISDSVSAMIYGSGNIDVYAAKYLYGHISGSGHVDYKGSPAVTDISVSGSGKFRKK